MIVNTHFWTQVKTVRNAISGTKWYWCFKAVSPVNILLIDIHAMGSPADLSGLIAVRTACDGKQAG